MPGRYVVVSAKVRRELKEEAERLGINISEVIRRALEEEVRRRRLEELERMLDRLGPALERVSVEDVVEAVRRSREER